MNTVPLSPTRVKLSATSQKDLLERTKVEAVRRTPCLNQGSRKKLENGRKSFDGSVRGASFRLLIHSVDEEDKLKRWKKHFAMTRNRITSGDVSLFVD